MYFDTEFWGIYIVIIGVVLVVALIVKLVSANHQANLEVDFMVKSASIKPGMTEAEVIETLGHGYSTSYLQNDVTKLEWIYRDFNSYPNFPGAFDKTISVCFKDGVVIEVHRHNV